MEPITLRNLLTAVNGTLQPGFSGDPVTTKITGIKSDNRICEAGDLFFAIVGEKNDGHKFAADALRRGAAGAVISRELPEEDMRALPDGAFLVRVPDTMQALGALAAWYRGRFQIPVIGVTGSVGKTTTKDMIASVLAAHWNTLKTEANFNNNIGLPRTIFRIDHTTEMAVIEMGMNHLGEIDYLVKIARPDCATITNVGIAHIGILGSRDNIFRAKSEIFNGLAKGGTAVLNRDDDYEPKLLDDQEKREKFRFVWVGEHKDADFRAENVDASRPDRVIFTAVTPDGRFNVVIPAPGRHMIYPALTAMAIGRQYGEPMEEILSGIASYAPTGKRLEAVHLPGNIVVYNDTYNANPQSVEAGLDTLTNLKGYRHVAVLGDMLELGEREEAYHRETGRYAAEHGADILVAVGRASRYTADEARKAGLSDVRYVETIDEAKPVLKELLQPDTAFLVKASHYTGIEALAQYLIEEGQGKE